jgi:hypothetical protein
MISIDNLRSHFQLTARDTIVVFDASLKSDLSCRLIENLIMIDFVSDSFRFLLYVPFHAVSLKLDVRTETSVESKPVASGVQLCKCQSPIKSRTT